MYRLAAVCAVITGMLSMAGAPSADAQQVHAADLYQQGNANYLRAGRDGCAATPANYVDALKFIFAYYQVRAPSAQAPEEEQIRRVLDVAQKKARECLTVGPTAGAWYRYDQRESGNPSVVSTVDVMPVLPPLATDVPTAVATDDRVQSLSVMMGQLTDRVQTAERERNALLQFANQVLPILSAPAGVWDLMVRVNSGPMVSMQLILVGTSRQLGAYLETNAVPFPGMNVAPERATPVYLGVAAPQHRQVSPNPALQPFITFNGQFRGQAVQLTLDLVELDLARGRTGVLKGEIASGGVLWFFSAYRPGDSRSR